jgi:hypothetical protein
MRLCVVFGLRVERDILMSENRADQRLALLAEVVNGLNKRIAHSENIRDYANKFLESVERYLEHKVPVVGKFIDDSGNEKPLYEDWFSSLSNAIKGYRGAIDRRMRKQFYRLSILIVFYYLSLDTDYVSDYNVDRMAEQLRSIFMLLHVAILPGRVFQDARKDDELERIDNKTAGEFTTLEHSQEMQEVQKERAKQETRLKGEKNAENDANKAPDDSEPDEKIGY